jgi:hypothetical protein
MSKPETKRRRDNTSPPRINKWTPRVAFLAFFVLAAIFFVQWLLSPDTFGRAGRGSNSPTPGPSNVASVLTVTSSEATPTITPRRDGKAVPPQEEVARQEEELTELQWVDYAQGLKGLRIKEWRGWIYDVRQPDETGMSKVEISLGRFSDGSLHYYEVVMQLNPDAARRLNKNDPVEFSGYIADVTCSGAYCKFILEDGKLTAGT